MRDSSAPRTRTRPPWLKATVVASALALVCLVDFLVLMPQQAAGTLDRGAVLVNVVVAFLSLPGMPVGRALYQTGHHVAYEHLTAYYMVVTAVTAALGWLLALVVFRRRARERARGAGRRSFLRRAAGWTVLGGLGLVGGYGVLLEPRWPRLRRLRFPLRGLPPGLAGLRLVHLTDLHLGRFTSAGYLRGVVERANALEPDLVLLTGDYVHGNTAFIPQVGQLLAALRPRLGTLGVLGNHDHWCDASMSRRALREAGVRLIDNDRVWVGAGRLSDRPRGGALCIAGLGDLWEDRTDLDAALGGVDPRLPRLLLSHNPDFAETHAARASEHRVDLMLCGHTHGGQVALPGIGRPVVPSRHGSKYAHGLVQGPRFPVFVSAGIGTTILPLRLRVRPEIVVLELVPAPGGRARRQVANPLTSC
jgi:predicted MPP superfamily phosphohydrolase